MKKRCMVFTCLLPFASSVFVALTTVSAAEAPSAKESMANGDTLNDKGRPDDTIETYSRAIHSGPSNDTAYTSRGRAYAEKGDYDRALADFSTAIRLNPRSARAYRCRSFAQYLRGAMPEALTDANESIRLDPNVADAYLVRSLEYKRLAGR